MSKNKRIVSQSHGQAVHWGADIEELDDPDGPIVTPAAGNALQQHQYMPHSTHIDSTSYQKFCTQFGRGSFELPPRQLTVVGNPVSSLPSPQLFKQPASKFLNENTAFDKTDGEKETEVNDTAGEVPLKHGRRGKWLKLMFGVGGVLLVALAVGLMAALIKTATGKKI